jgi:hypothetical protein
MMSGGSTSRQLRKLSRKLCLELIRRRWKWKVGRKSLSVKFLKLAQEEGSIKPLLLTLITYVKSLGISNESSQIHDSSANYDSLAVAITSKQKAPSIDVQGLRVHLILPELKITFVTSRYF